VLDGLFSGSIALLEFGGRVGTEGLGDFIPLLQRALDGGCKFFRYGNPQKPNQIYTVSRKKEPTVF